MVNTSIEITENEYLIKLNRQNFNLSFIRSLLKMVEVANPSEEVSHGVPDKHYVPYMNHSAEPEYYSSIEEK